MTVRTPREHLIELVKLPSVNPMGRGDIPDSMTLEHRVTAYLGAELVALGVSVERQAVAPGRDNLVAHFAPPNSQGHYLWECHQDTVPVDAMTIDPFGALEVGGRLYGRGACDVKAGAAAMLAAFARLVEANTPGGAAVTLAFTVDEEHTFLGVAKLVELLRSRPKLDGAVVAEPTGLDVVVAHKGVIRWVLETSGRACHSSRPENGVNAVYRMLPVAKVAQDHAAELAAGRRDDDLGPASLSLGVIHGGTSSNVVPDFCRVDLDRRLIPGETPESAWAQLAERLAAAGLAGEYKLHPVAFACPALEATPASRAFAARLAGIASGVKPGRTVGVAPYGTDASAISRLGVPAVVFGPGDIAQAHTKDEWVDVGEVELAARALVEMASF